jgi:hypothetical protein
MKDALRRPRIYGSNKRFKAAISRHVERAQELLDQAEGVRKMIDAIPGKPGSGPRLIDNVRRSLLEDQWVQAVHRWHRSVGGRLGGILQMPDRVFCRP